MRRTLAVVGLALLLVGAPGPARAASEGTKARLPNGLTVIVRENGTAPVVAVSLFVRVGGRWESPETAGITNLLQQLLLKGTASRSALEVTLEAERIGGTIGASTDPDFAELKGTALARHWKDLLALVAEVALRPSLPATELESERRAVLAAIRNRQDQPSSLAYDTLMSRLFGDHPYGLPAAGRAEAVRRLERDALLAHYRRYYHAGRMILSVSGDVRAAEVVDEAGRRFAGAPAGEGAPEPVLPAPRPAAGRTGVAHPSAQTQILLGFAAPPAGHPDYPALKVLSVALGGGMAGRFFTELRDKQGLAYVTGASYPTRVSSSFFLGQMATAPGNAARAEEAMREQVERIRREGVSPDELARAKAYLLGQLALDRRTNARLAWYAAFFEAAGLGHDFAARYARAVEGVTGEDLKVVAERYLVAPAVVVLGPAGR